VNGGRIGLNNWLHWAKEFVLAKVVKVNTLILFQSNAGSNRRSHFYRHVMPVSKTQVESKPDIFYADLNSCNQTIFVTREDDIVIFRNYFNTQLQYVNCKLN